MRRSSVVTGEIAREPGGELGEGSLGDGANIMQKLISARAIERRCYWINEIVRIVGKFGDDSSRVEQELEEEIRQHGFSSILDHLRLCGAIPESYGHDTSEEKLYSKYTDALLAVTFRYFGLKAAVLTERADAADVEVHGKRFSFVADAKVFRLSRTAKNQKDFKVSAMHGWKRGKPYALVVCPLYQLPTRSSQIYHQAASLNVCIFSYSHLAALVAFTEQKGKDAGIALLEAIFKAVEALNPSKDAASYWTAVNRAMIGFDDICAKLWTAEKVANLESIAVAKELASRHLAAERARIMGLSHEEALQALIDMQKLDSRQATIRAVADNGLMLLK